MAISGTVLVVASHRSSGRSMIRYSRLLADAWRDTGVRVEVTSPPYLLARLSTSPSAIKWLAYIDTFLLYPPVLVYRASRATVVHIADHSDSILLFAVRTSVMKIVTVHDLIAVRAALGKIPEHRTRRSGRIYQMLVLCGLRMADRLVAVSKATALDIAELTSRDAQVVYNPIDPNFTVGRRPEHVDDAYLLVVSSVGWRKRREFAIQVWLALRATQRLHGSKLVIVGDPITSAEKEVLADVSPSEIYFSGRVSEARLSDLYAGCTAVMQLSRYEGFGWPIVEGNSYNKPALCSDISVLRETAGESGVFVADGSLMNSDWESIAEQLTCLARTDKPARNLERFCWPLFVAGLEGLVQK